MASTTTLRPGRRFSICSCVYAARKAVTFSGGLLFFPAALTSDCCIDLVSGCASPGLAAWLDQRRCALALSATLAWMTYLILWFNRPLIAGVCVCRHEMWDSSSRTIEARTISEVTFSDLIFTVAASVLLVVSCIAETCARLCQGVCEHPVTTSCVLASWFWLR